MSVKFLKPHWAETIQPFVNKLSVILFLTIIFSIIVDQWNLLPEFLNQVGLVITVMIILAMLSGYLLSRLSGLSASQVKTTTIEVGMQNGGMALIVTQGVLQNSTMSIVPVIYGLIMLIPVTVYILFNRNETAPAV